MGTFTIYNALSAEIAPYTVDSVTLQKALIDAGLGDSVESEYTAEAKRSVVKAAISVLKKLIVLSSDSLGKSSQGYNVEALKKRIKALCLENDLEVDDIVEASSITDGSNLW